MAIPSLAMIPSGYKDGKVYSVLPSNGDGDFTFSRGSNATRVNKDGLIETITGDTPRLDYSDSSCPSLLLEPQSTNLITYSEDFSDSSWTKSNTTLEANVITSPDGTLTATKLLETTTNSAHVLFDATTGLTPNSPYNFSIFVKKLNRRYVGIQTIAAASQSAIAFFDLDNGILVYTFAIGTGYSVSNAKIEKYSDGWYRLSATFTTPVAANYPNICLADSKWTTGSSYNNFYTGDTTKGVYVWGGQYEQGSYATSYIPTNGASATRLADVCNDAGTSDTFNDSEGVLMAEISALANDGSYKTLTINNNGVSDRIQISINSNNVFIGVIDGDSAEIFQSYSVSNITNNNKIAVKYKLNDCSLWINGIAVLDNLAASMPSGLSKISFDKGNGADDFYGNIKQIQYFNTALTDLELQQLTTI